jgi:hypothetical protein
MIVWKTARYGAATRHTATIAGQSVSISERPDRRAVRCTRLSDSGTGEFRFSAQSVTWGKALLECWAQNVKKGSA